MFYFFRYIKKNVNKNFKFANCPFKIFSSPVVQDDYALKKSQHLTPPTEATGGLKSMKAW